MNKLYIVGIGPGSIDMVTPVAMKAIEQSNILIGGKRNLEIFDYLSKKKYTISNNLNEIIQIINENIECEKIAVLASGDPNIYGITSFIKTHFKEIEIVVLPGISSLQYLAARSMISLNDIYITSVHGRDIKNLDDIVKNNEKVALFTDSKNTPANVCYMLLKNGVKNVKVTIGENLSSENERVLKGTLEEMREVLFSPLCVMIIENNCMKKEKKVYAGPGVPDNMFIRSSVPMTKQEIRAVAISKLMLKKDSIVYDIGAGTGSVSVECGILAKEGLVYAIEKNEEALELINKNIVKFELDNVNIVRAEAPAKLDQLPLPNRIFIGGTDGNMDEIINWIATRCKNVKVVINAITIESTYEAVRSLENNGFLDIDITGLSISKSMKAGRKHIMKGLNPINIICAHLGGLE